MRLSRSPLPSTPEMPSAAAASAASVWSRNAVKSRIPLAGVVAQDALGDLETVQDRHAEVEQHQIGAELAVALERLAAVGRLADDVDELVQIEHRAQQEAQIRLVVDDQHPDRPGQIGRRGHHHAAVSSLITLGSRSRSVLDTQRLMPISAACARTTSSRKAL